MGEGKAGHAVLGLGGSESEPRPGVSRPTQPTPAPPPELWGGGLARFCAVPHASHEPRGATAHWTSGQCD